MYSNYLKSKHWKDKRVEKLRFCSHCQICGETKNLNIHHRRYKISQRESERSFKRGLNLAAGSILGREEIKDLMTLCPACHKLWHFNFGNRYLTHKKASQIKRLIDLGIPRIKAFFVTKNNFLYTPILLKAKTIRPRNERAVKTTRFFVGQMVNNAGAARKPVATVFINGEQEQPTNLAHTHTPYQPNI